MGFIPVRWFSRRISEPSTVLNDMNHQLEYAESSNWESSSTKLHQHHQKKETSSPAKSTQIHKLKGSEKTESIPQITQLCGILKGLLAPKDPGMFPSPEAPG